MEVAVASRPSATGCRPGGEAAVRAESGAGCRGPLVGAAAGSVAGGVFGAGRRHDGLGLLGERVLARETLEGGELAGVDDRRLVGVRDGREL